MSVDNNYESHAYETDLVISDRQIAPENPQDYSDILKFSFCKDVTVNNCIIYGGKEDNIDAVRGSNYVFKKLSLNSLGANGITLKGSLNGFTIEDVAFTSHGKECDIELGQFDNYWYVGRPPTRNGKLVNLTTTDDKPIKLRIWDATVPEITNSNVKVIKIPKFIWFPYFVFRAIQTRGIKNIFKPVPDSQIIKTK